MTRPDTATQAADFTAFNDSLERCLDANKPHELSAALGQSPTHQRQLWDAMVRLGAPQLGSPDMGGLQAALHPVRILGGGNCVVPILECVLLNALLPAPLPDWIELIHSGSVQPALAMSAATPERDGGRLMLDGSTVTGCVDLVESCGATNLAALAWQFDGAVALTWTSLDQFAVQCRSQSAYLEPVLSEITLHRASCTAIPLTSLLGADFALLWRYLLTVRATGALSRALTAVIAHVQQRYQFGVPIGSFQAVQHKLVDVYMAIEGARLTQDAAARAFDAQRPNWRYECSAAIAAADPVLRLKMLEIHHVFGAIGYSEEHVAPRYFRCVHLDLARARGDPARGHLFETIAGATAPTLGEPYLSVELDSFRLEVRHWLRDNWPRPAQDREAQRPAQHQGFDADFSRKLGQAGWIALTWPPCYGGGGRSKLYQWVLVQELARVRAPIQAHLAAASLIAPALIAFGSVAQKEKYLPRIARGEMTACLGYSEPDSGSDLASLRTTAVRDGNDYVIRGQKSWGTLTDKATHVWLAARTDPTARKQAGISIFLVPLSTPGIIIRPHMSLSGKTFCTQFYDDVRVSSDSLVGEVNQGWKVITGALADERILMGSLVAQLSVVLSQLIGLLKSRGCIGSLAQDQVGALLASIGVANAFLERCVRLTDADRPAQIEAAIAKVYSSELMEQFGEAAIALLGPRAALSANSLGAMLDGEMERLLRFSVMQVIGGGTNEIQRTLIAQRGLGLPR